MEGNQRAFVTETRGLSEFLVYVAANLEQFEAAPELVLEFEEALASLEAVDRESRPRLVPVDLVARLFKTHRAALGPEAPDGDPFWLHQILSGGRIVYRPPEPGPIYLEPSKRAALEAALAEKDYARLVANVDVKAAALVAGGGLAGARPSYTASSLGAGSELILATGTLFAFGYHIAPLLGIPISDTGRLIAGLAGAVLGLFLEGYLYVIRAARFEAASRPRARANKALAAEMVAAYRLGTQTPPPRTELSVKKTQ